ncbi:MAG: hypothetical protein GF384_00455 [Elusimicrobia bacterium]|nr:hypothetical protein [Elusimicrobiota bacterium]
MAIILSLPLLGICGWDLDSIDTNGAVGTFNSITTDSQDRLHVAYFDETNMRLKYAKQEENGWDIKVVDSFTSNYNIDSAIVVGSGNVPYIGYIDGSNIKFAKWNGASWDIKSHYTTTSSSELDMVLINGHEPHIVYTDNYNKALFHVWFDGSQWHYKQVDILAEFENPSLAVDSSGYLHVVYQKIDGARSDLYYAYYDGSRWDDQVLDTRANSCWYPSLALDNNNNPCVAYHRDTYEDQLVFGSGEPGVSWRGDAVFGKTPGSNYFIPRLVFDSEYNPHITYVDYKSGWPSTLFYTCKKDQQWENPEIITAKSGGCHDLAINTDNKLHEIFFNMETYHLIYATPVHEYSIELLAPEGGNLITGEYTVEWNQSESFYVDILFSGDGGENYRILADNLNNSSSYDWDTDGFETIQGKIRVVKSDDPSVFDENEKVFRVDNTPPIKIAAPTITPIGENRYNVRVKWDYAKDPESGVGSYWLTVQEVGNKEYVYDNPPVYFDHHDFVLDHDCEIVAWVKYWNNVHLSNQSDLSEIYSTRKTPDGEDDGEEDDETDVILEEMPDEFIEALADGNAVQLIGGAQGFVNLTDNETVTFMFQAKQSGNIELHVYTLQGDLVYETSKQTDGSIDSMVWEGRNSDYDFVASGIYVAFIKGPGIEEIKKVPIVR